MAKPFVTRFAPSPTGLLHLGHAFSALLAAKAAKESQGRFLLRIEDIDIMRCRQEFEDAIFEDLTWLGLSWEIPTRRQSDQLADYKSAIDTLTKKNLLYPCFCTRKEIQTEIQKSSTAPHGPDGFLYPGTCRNLAKTKAAEKVANGSPYALRLNLEQALQSLPSPLTFIEKGEEIIAQPQGLGDVVVARKDVMTSYHLAVVVDDHLQKISHVIRGEDLYHTTHIHRLLQALLGLETPRYYHHPLLVGADGKRFAKRDKSLTLKSLREGGMTPKEVFDLIKVHGGNLDTELRF